MTNSNKITFITQVNIKSLEDVAKTEAARQVSRQVVLDIDDLDQPDTPEW